jgi:DNA-binding XRE family transcriptional regulator
MAKLRKADFRPAREWIDRLPPERLDAVRAGAEAIVAEARLDQVRKALTVTQVELAKASGLRQAEISRIENNLTTVQLRTLERYISGLGGTLKVVAEFPGGSQAVIPMRAGKPVKSRVTVEPKPPAPND